MRLTTLALAAALVLGALALPALTDAPDLAPAASACTGDPSVCGVVRDARCLLADPDPDCVRTLP